MSTLDGSRPGSRSIKLAVKSLAASAIGWHVVSKLRPKGVTVLTYHRIGGPGDRFPGLPLEAFTEQMRWVAARCRPIAPAQLFEAAWMKETRQPPILVTFDDGYLSFRERAYPVLKELGIPAVVFLATAYIDEPTRLFWWDTLRAAVEGSASDSLEFPWAPGIRLPMTQRGDRERVLAQAKSHLKAVTDDQRLMDLAALLDRLGTANRSPRAAKEMMDWNDVRAVLDNTYIGGHTHTHPVMSSVTDTQLETELATCRERIESETTLTPRWFAYPNGRAQDFDHRSRAALLRHGFDMAFTTEGRVIEPEADRLALGRFSGDGTRAELAWRISVQARNDADRGRPSRV